MKKISLILLLFICVSLYANAKVTVFKQAGSATGYYSIIETHVGGDAELICTDPGDAGCVWTTPPTRREIRHNAETRVLDEIAKGNFAGSMVIDNILVSWMGTDEYNFRMEINIEATNNH